MDPQIPARSLDTTQAQVRNEEANVVPLLPTPADSRAFLNQYPFLTAPARPDALGYLGPYRITGVLGKGGMGVVFRAEDDLLQRSVALKVMQSGWDDGIARERFFREARAAAAIKSDHVVTIHQVGEENGVPYLAMELLKGQNLNDWLANRGLSDRGVSKVDVVRIAKGMLKGLVAVHKKGLIHRDIKPGNLWIEKPKGRVKLLDFGLTRTDSDLDPAVTRPGQILGTPAYMAPEQAQGLPLDARCDLFSAGVVLYRMVSGRNPFVQEREPVEATLAALQTLRPPPVASFGLVPEELAKLIDRLMSKSPDERPATAEAALQVVQRAARQIRERYPASPTLIAPAPPDHSPESSISVVNFVARSSLLEETTEEFEYVFDGSTKKGTRRIIVLDLGGGQSMTFIRIGKGRFLMGAPDDEEEAEDNEMPQREIEIGRDFFLGMYAVTQAQYQAVTGETRGRFRGDRRPVESVSWEDAVAFCERVSDRTKRKVDLPTEAEWEYACRAGTTTPFHFGSALNGALANCDGSSPYGSLSAGVSKRMTSEVGSYPANPWGLYDMHGNVWEWCADYYGPYTKANAPSDPAQSTRRSKDSRILRGGAWGCDAKMCRAAARMRNKPGDQGYSYGFRVCLRLDS